MSHLRLLVLLCASFVLASCVSNETKVGGSLERVVSGDWAARFADDPTAHLVSLPPGRSFFDAWVYQFGSSPSEWATRNMECGPAGVSILERLSGRPGTNCAYQASIDGCPSAVHSECRQVGACGSSTGFTQNSAHGTTVYQVRDVLNGLGLPSRAISGSGDDQVTFSALRRAIDADHPMVVSVNACEYQRELDLSVCSHSHFIVAYGYSDQYVYLLDPGYRNGQRARISINAFNRAIALDPSGVEVTRPGFEQSPNATWYPPGSLLYADGESYYVVSPNADGSPRLRHASLHALEANRLSTERAIHVSRDVIGCFESLGELDSTQHFREYRIETGEIFLVNLAARERYVFLNYAAYLSYNGREEWRASTPSEIAEWSAYPLNGTLGFAPGMLIASDEPGVSTVWVVSYNDRGRIHLPIFNEETARIYGYDVSDIGSSPLRSARAAARDLDLLTGPEGEMIRIELARDCAGRHCLTADACFAHSTPGGIDEAVGGEQDGTAPSASASDPPPSSASDRDGDGQPDSEDCVPDDPSSYRGAPELCNGQDNNCDGIPDNGIPDRMSSNSCGEIIRSCREGVWIMASGRDPEPEVCNGIDDDCNGSVDEHACPPTPDASVLDPNEIHIRLSSALESECVGGWEINLWGESPIVHTSAPGAMLSESVATWSGWSSLTLSCPSGSPYWKDWSSHAGTAVQEGDFLELSLGGSDMRSQVLVCTDPANPSGGQRPIIMWDPAMRGTCPGSS